MISKDTRFCQRLKRKSSAIYCFNRRMKIKASDHFCQNNQMSNLHMIVGPPFTDWMLFPFLFFCLFVVTKKLQLYTYTVCPKLLYLIGSSGYYLPHSPSLHCSFIINLRRPLPSWSRYRHKL